MPPKGPAGSPPHGGMPPGGGVAPQGGQAPAAAGMMTPQEPAGQQEASRVEVLLATKMLERAIPAFGSQSKEGQAIMTALKSLGAHFGKTEGSTEQLMPAELRKMISEFTGPGMPGPPPGAGAPPGGPPQGGMPG